MCGDVHKSLTYENKLLHLFRVAAGCFLYGPSFFIAKTEPKTKTRGVECEKFHMIFVLDDSFMISTL